MLGVSEEYAKSILCRDAAHLLESTLGDVKKVTPWIQKLFAFLTTVIVQFRVRSAQNTLKKECEKLECPFYTFHVLHGSMNMRLSFCKYIDYMW